MTEAGEEFVRDLRAIQDPDRWLAGRQSLFDTWIGDSGNALVAEHLERDMASFDFDMWARSCRVIADAYRTWGSPMRRMAHLDPERPVMHLYSQPIEAGYTAAQREFGATHPWFRPQYIAGRSHFPTLESPELLVDHVVDFVDRDR